MNCWFSLERKTINENFPTLVRAIFPLVYMYCVWGKSKGDLYGFWAKMKGKSSLYVSAAIVKGNSQQADAFGGSSVREKLTAQSVPPPSRHLRPCTILRGESTKQRWQVNRATDGFGEACSFPVVKKVLFWQSDYTCLHFTRQSYHNKPPSCLLRTKT